MTSFSESLASARAYYLPESLAQLVAVATTSVRDGGGCRVGSAMEALVPDQRLLYGTTGAVVGMRRDVTDALGF